MFIFLLTNLLANFKKRVKHLQVQKMSCEKYKFFMTLNKKESKRKSLQNKHKN